MLTETKQIIKEDISNRIIQFNIINEANTNAIHSYAKFIDCVLNSCNNPLNNGSKLLFKRKVDYILISDNFDGLDDKNYNSFCKYLSEYKMDLGSKGVDYLINSNTKKVVTYSEMQIIL